MRKIIILTVLLVSLTATAQYAPNTKWPYLNEAFQHGTIYFDTDKRTEADLNIHLWKNALHYISEDGRIFEAPQNGLMRVEIGNKAYIPVNRELMEIVAVKGVNMLLKLEKANFDSMNEGTGAYGASLNSSSSKDLSSLDLGGMNNPKLGEMLQQRHDGREIPINVRFYFLFGEKLVEANKASVESLIGNDCREKWKVFQKERKIKWKKEASLKEVLDFVSNSIKLPSAI